MSIIFVLLPASLLLAFIAIVGYIWATRSGQFDDLETPSQRILMDGISTDDQQQDLLNQQSDQQPK